MGTISDAWYAFLSATLGTQVGSANDLQNQFATKYAGGLDAYMGNMLGRRFRSGYFYHFDEAVNETTLTPAADVLILNAFTVGKPTAFNQISLETTVAGVGSTADVVLYDSDSITGFPRTVLAAANLSLNAVAIPTSAINVTLQPGIYWIGAVCHATTTMATVRGKGGGQSRYIGSPNSQGAGYTCLNLAAVAAAPGNSPAVNPGTNGISPKVMLRAA